jgi:hypothetical protein
MLSHTRVWFTTYVATLPREPVVNVYRLYTVVIQRTDATADTLRIA